jgi:glycosyltransferase involved in cell wall biosynthesis
MRIAMISTPFVAVPPRGYGGTELIVSTLAEALHARGHQVTLFATGDSQSRAELGALYPVAQWPPDPLTDVNHVSWALQQVRDEPFDVVHAHSAVALGMARLLPALPLVYTLHHERDETLSRFYRYLPRARYVAISADQAAREVALPRLEVIHHGLDPAAHAWTERPGDYLCFVGRFTEVKGPHTAIDVAARAGMPIRVAGEVHAPDHAFAEREVLPRLVASHVTYVGCVGPAAKRPLLRDARALLAPIAWNEPFGLILIEAMLSGCPVVALRRGSVPELVEEGVTGFVADTPDEMVALVRPDGPLARFDRRRCRARAVERFSAARMVADYERCYARAILEQGAPCDDTPVRPRVTARDDDEWRGAMRIA